MRFAGVDFSTRAVDVVLLDMEGAAEWHRYELTGADGFDRARQVRNAMPSRSNELWDDVVALAIEEPRGHSNGALLRVQGAILACLPSSLLVEPLTPNQWRKAVGLPGNASKEDVTLWAAVEWRNIPGFIEQDACDAYCLAYAVRARTRIGEAE